jgi:hypothetical protein
MLKLGLLLVLSATSEDPFSESAKFERWSHFKDYGVPAVMGKDALNSAAIADGSCRLVQQSDGFYFWHYPSRVERVLRALADAPPTSNPSYFVLSLEKALRAACSDNDDKASRPEFKLESLATSVQNWYHALVAPSSDPSWNGQFDPAYQPQQVVLTTGFMCVAACDLNGGMLSESAMRSLADMGSYLPKTINATFPWVTNSTIFSGARSTKELAQALKSILRKPCGCTDQPIEAKSKLCPDNLRAVYADMHDGDKKLITISGTALTIKPSGNNQSWIVSSELDSKSCGASINFSVPGKPGPPPVNLQANLWYSLSSKGEKTVFEFTDPSGTLATKAFPLNHWVEELKNEHAISFPCPGQLHAIYADMHDGDKKEVTISGTSLTIKPSGNNQTWVVKSEIDSKSCSASIDFNVPGKPNPPPVNLQATLASIFSASSSSIRKTEFEFTDPSGTLAASTEPLNQWVEISRHTYSGSDYAIVV